MTSWATPYEAFAEPIIAAEDVAGLAVAVAEGGRPVYFRGFGHRDRARDLPVTEHTLFGIGSITKSFTAVAIMQLQEAGRLSVDDPVARHVPELRVPHADGPTPMRIRHLLSHSAGLPPLPTLRATLVRSLRDDPDVKDETKAKLPAPVDTWDELVAYLNACEIEPLGRPGDLFSYSNDGYALLGLIVERASGEPYAAYVERHILAPAGMSETTFDIAPHVEGPDTTRLYNRKKGDAERKVAYDAGPWWDAGPMTAAGFLRSSAHDMLRYLEIYRTGGRVGGEVVLTPESVREMVTPRIVCGARMDYGYGLMLSAEHAGVHLVEHGGNIKGAAAWVTVVPERDLTAVGLSNLSGAPTSRLLLGAVNAALGIAPERLRAEFPLPYEAAAPMSDYAGVYASGEDVRMEVREGEQGLDVHIEDEHYPLRAVEADAFVFDAHGDQSYIRFLRAPDGRVSAVASHFRIVRRAADLGPDGHAQTVGR
jgi:CubicO group peptidase (beta-lactamase class C family)